ncbi:MAG: MarR family transcriptional regulator [Tepidiformaceae bacterium]
MPEVQRSPEIETALTAFFAASALLDPLRLTIWDRDGLTVTQLRLLGHLADREGLSNAELADLMYVTRPSISALLERLERGGFIRREVAPNDRRGICIWMEPRGREVVSNLREELRNYSAHLMAELTSAEVAAFTSAVGRFAEAGAALRRRVLASESAVEA